MLLLGASLQIDEFRKLIEAPLSQNTKALKSFLRQNRITAKHNNIAMLRLITAKMLVHLETAKSMEICTLRFGHTVVPILSVQEQCYFRFSRVSLSHFRNFWGFFRGTHFPGWIEVEPFKYGWRSIKHQWRPCSRWIFEAGFEGGLKDDPPEPIPPDL